MNKQLKHYGFVFVLTLLIFFIQTGQLWAAQTITLGEALDLVFKKNQAHSLFLQEQELIQEKQKLKKHPSLSAITSPLKIEDGKWKNPQGSLEVEMPLASGLSLSGALALEVDREGLKALPHGSVSLNYSFFAVPELKPVDLDITLQVQENSLVLETFTLLARLRQVLDQKGLEQARLDLLQLKLAAAHETANYDPSELEKEYGGQKQKLVELNDNLQALEQELAFFLGLKPSQKYEPQLKVNTQLQLEWEKYQQELFQASPQWAQAQQQLELAEKQLEKERRSRGWNLQAVGSASLEDWQLGLSASKTLYPYHVVLSELELVVERAKQNLEQLKMTLENNLRLAFQRVEKNQSTLEKNKELLAEQRRNLALEERKFKAGLNTELQLLESQLQLEEAKLACKHSELSYGLSMLQLWNLCGLDLRITFTQVVN